MKGAGNFLSSQAACKYVSNTGYDPGSPDLREQCQDHGLLIHVVQIELMITAGHRHGALPPPRPCLEPHIYQTSRSYSASVKGHGRPDGYGMDAEWKQLTNYRFIVSSIRLAKSY